MNHSFRDRGFSVIVFLIVLAAVCIVIGYYLTSYARHETFTNTQKPTSNFGDDINAAQKAKSQSEQDNRLLK